MTSPRILSQNLDELVEDSEASSELAKELFSVVDLCDSHSELRRAISDPGTSVEARQSLVHHLLDGKVSTQTCDIVTQAASRRWIRMSAMPDALEMLAVRSVLVEAREQGHLDDVEEELFRLRQVILADVELQEAFNRRARPVADRQDLVNHLLDGRTQPQSILLARRAVVARTASMLTTLSTYMEQAVAVRERTLAVVTTATELSDDQRRRIHEQVERITGREVVMHEIVDPNVLGGARVEVGNEVIDGTVASRLDQARRKLG